MSQRHLWAPREEIFREGGHQYVVVTKAMPREESI